MSGSILEIRSRSLEARRVLALTEGSLRDRFAAAYAQGIVFMRPLDDGARDFVASDEIASRVRAFLDRASQYPSADTEGRVMATLQLLSDDQVHQLAEDFLGLCLDIDREYFEATLE